MTTHTPIVLILDDDPTRHAQFIQNNPGCDIRSAYTVNEATALVYDQYFDIICFDHDLGMSSTGEYETSIPFAKTVRELIDSGALLDSTLMLVHTSNPVGAQNIMSYFARTLVHTFKVPWAWTRKSLFRMMMEPEPSYER